MEPKKGKVFTIELSYTAHKSGNAVKEYLKFLDASRKKNTGPNSYVSQRAGPPRKGRSGGPAKPPRGTSLCGEEE